METRIFSPVLLSVIAVLFAAPVSSQVLNTTSEIHYNNGLYSPVVVNDLEWLPWNETTGMNIGDALQLYPDYRLATDVEVAGLFDKKFWSGSYVAWYYGLPSWTETLASQRDASGDYGGFASVLGDYWAAASDFMYEFGSTYSYFTECVADCIEDREYYLVDARASAVYFQKTGVSTENESIGWAEVFNNSLAGSRPGTALMSGNSPSRKYRALGWALVKSTNSVPEIDAANAGLGIVLVLLIVAIYRERAMEYQCSGRDAIVL